MSQIKGSHGGIGSDGFRRAPQVTEVDEAGALDRVLCLGWNSEVGAVMIGSQNLHGSLLFAIHPTIGNRNGSSRFSEQSVGPILNQHQVSGLQ
jgi:hypothetical protein